jgi:hypothetical protein
MQRTIWILSFAVLSSQFGLFADATAEIDWLLLPSGGTYCWNPGSTQCGPNSADLYGSNIGVSSVGGVGTASNNESTLSISYGLMNFTSGAYNGNGSNWSWGGGDPGTLNITGCIAGVTSATCDGSNNVQLLSDDFQSISIIPVVSLGPYNFDVMFGNLQGTLDSAVASYFGVSPSFNATSLNLLFTAGTPGHAFTGTNIGGQIQAKSSVSVPEEWSLASTLTLFAFAGAVFGVAWRLGFLQRAVS